MTEVVASKPRPSRKGARAYLVASLVGQVFALLRYSVLARLIGPEQLGMAALLILTSQFLSSVSDTGSERFIVQDRDGDSPRLLGVVHSAMVLRGIAIAAALVIFAGPLSALYDAAEIRSSLMWLGLTPLLLGFVHFGTRQAQRANDFRPESATIICSEMAALIGTAAAAFVVRDHTAVIYGLVLRAVILVIVSHIVSKQPYRLGYAKPEALRFSAFAAPLFLNGLLLFAGQQGDRVLIASTEGAKALGYYSAILLLVQSPMSAMARFMTTVHLPPLAARRADPAQFAEAADRLGGRMALITVVAATGFTLVGPTATWLLYGKEFVQPLGLFALLAALQTLRFARSWPNTVAISVSRSGVMTVNNVARLVAIPAAFACIAAGWGLEGVVAGYIVGEVAAIIVSLIQLSLSKTIELRREMVRVGLMSLLLATLCGWSLTIDARGLWILPVLAFFSVAGMAAFVRNERSTLVELASLAKRRLRFRR